MTQENFENEPGQEEQAHKRRLMRWAAAMR